MAANIPPSESDYGSDFSLEEENLVIELLDGLQPIPIETQTTSKSTHQSTVGIATPLLPEKRSFDDASFQDASDRRPASMGQARTPASMRANISRAALHESWQMASMPLDGIDYPDRKSHSLNALISD